MFTNENKDIIKPKETLPEHYPEVYMEIQQIKDTTIEKESNKLLLTLSNKYMTIKGPIQISSPVNGVLLKAIGGSNGKEWNDPVLKISFS